MAEKLVVLSDMWGVKKGLWITSYFGYLQQYYDITFYDIQQLGNIDVAICTDENVHRAFLDGGIDTAVKQLVQKQTESAHYLAFSMGGAIAWKAALQGLPVKSITAISPTRVRFESERPVCELDLIFGAEDVFKPDDQWSKSTGVPINVVQGFGHLLYTDEKIIGEVCLKLLQTVTKKAV